MSRRPTIRAGSHEAWTVFALLLVAVTVPTACVLWFMTHAMRNEQLAARQTLTDAYRGQLIALQGELDARWAARLAGAAKRDWPADPHVAFASWVRSGVCHAAILYDANGRQVYPESDQDIADDTSTSGPFADAARLEQGDPEQAADAYAEIAGDDDDVNIAARALVGRARCLVRMGQAESAIRLLLGPLAEAEYARAVDRNGRWIVPNSRLLALQLLRNRDAAQVREIAAALARQLDDYSLPIPSRQRRFLMEQLVAMAPDVAACSMLDAERLAGRYFEAIEEPSALAAQLAMPFLIVRPNANAAPTAQLAPATAAGIWQIATPDGRAVLLYDQERLSREVQSLNTYRPLTAFGRVELMPPASRMSGTALLDIAAGSHLPQWRLALFIDNSDPFKLAAARMTAIYFWTGILVVVVIALLAMLAARYVSRQMRFTRLKNDLIATVSHELRTPLSSIRLLVETLLDNRCGNPEQTLDYLGLIANENKRLCRLVDNFLTFSRMERNKRVFAFIEVDPREIARLAVDAVHERFAAADCRPELDVESNLPAVLVDRDAMVTVLVNLLDNACKYTDAPRRIGLRVYHADGCVCFAVKDNGIGMSRRAVRKIFDRFYQVDQRLSRRAGGCGLGLSIVKFIVDAHHGEIRVESRPGQGSTFTVRLAAGNRIIESVQAVTKHGE
jgi:signal transduction histidine kinase